LGLGGRGYGKNGMLEGKGEDRVCRFSKDVGCRNRKTDLERTEMASRNQTLGGKRERPRTSKG